MTIHASRRDVLKGGGALVVSFSFAGAISETRAQGTKPLALTEVDSFLAIDAGGEVTIYSGKVDLGTGIATALPQIVADELVVLRIFRGGGLGMVELERKRLASDQLTVADPFATGADHAVDDLEVLFLGVQTLGRLLEQRGLGGCRGVAQLHASDLNR